MLLVVQRVCQQMHSVRSLILPAVTKRMRLYSAVCDLPKKIANSIAKYDLDCEAFGLLRKRRRKVLICFLRSKDVSRKYALVQLC